MLKAATGEQLIRAQLWLDKSIQSLARQLRPCLRLTLAWPPSSTGCEENKKLKKIGRADLLIAAIALANRARKVSRHQKHFRLIPRWQIETWAD